MFSVENLTWDFGFSVCCWSSSVKRYIIACLDFHPMLHLQESWRFYILCNIKFTHSLACSPHISIRVRPLIILDFFSWDFVVAEFDRSWTQTWRSGGHLSGGRSTGLWSDGRYDQKIFIEHVQQHRRVLARASRRGCLQILDSQKGWRVWHCRW